MLTPATLPRCPDDHVRPTSKACAAWRSCSSCPFHAGLGTVPGGFVGVDVFFVISAFLGLLSTG